MNSGMTLRRQAVEIFSQWIDSVAIILHSLFERFGSRREIQLVEQENDTFTFHLVNGVKQSGIPDHHVRLQNGALPDRLPAAWKAALRNCRVEIVLRPTRFLFRPLALPKRATDFLDGIIRAQIDRLTPWSASDAVFHWTRPADVTNDQIHVTIAATARAVIAPYIRLAAELGAASIAVSTVNQDEPAAAPITVFEQRSRAAIERRRIRRVLVAVFLVSAAAAVVWTGIDAVAGGSLDAERYDLAQKIAARRAALLGVQDPETTRARRLLEQRKRELPSSVIVLEALSQILPDHTYVTELRIDGDKLQLVGITRDAPSLI
ncbi:MAG: PilN domain-containing protein, partial [Bradyrhizobiaceae bacterium]|nr:PilN domain-containing protein [Bradyrhizobiaceae bacterium]